jgi:hypothetical protein
MAEADTVSSLVDGDEPSFRLRAQVRYPYALDDDTGLTARYSYSGIGPGSGIPVHYEGETGWHTFTTKQYLTLEDFEGDAIHGSFGVIGRVEEYTLVNRGAEGETVSLKGTGVGAAVGASQTVGPLILVDYSQKEPR